MLSGKLIHLIELHEKEIATSIIKAVRRHPDLVHMAKLPDGELRERGREILMNLGHWLAHGHEDKLAMDYESVGRERFAENVPLHESIWVLCLIKDRMVDFLGEQGIERDFLSLYAEEEFERRVGRFFDLLVIHLARGYEKAWCHAAHAVA